MAVSIILVVVAVMLVAVLFIAVSRRRRAADDGVDSFRRQIDALSPEARRPTIDQMKPSEPPSADDDGDHDQ